MNIKNKAILVVSILIALCGLVSVGVAVEEKLHGWDLFYSEGGKSFGTEMAKKTDISSVVGAFEDLSIGTAGDSFSSSKKSFKIFSPNSKNTITSTSPAISLLNDSGVDRILTRCAVFMEGTSAWSGEYHEQGAGGVVLDFGTSTSATASSSVPIWSTSYASSSLEVVSFTTNTLHAQVEGGNPNGWKRIWKDGEYLNVDFSSSVSSTGGYAGCEWELFN